MYKVTGGDGREYGPISADQVRQWLAEGRLNAGTPLKVEGGDWKPLYQFTEFASAIANSGATAPPGNIGQGLYSSEPVRTSGMAITSLVLGIMGLFTCGLTGIVGLILGIVSLGKIKKSDGRLTGAGLAITGIVTSGIFLLMLPVWAALMLPALARAKSKAQTAVCMNHGKQLGLGARMYADGHGDQLPPAATWSDAISSQVGSPDAFECPTQPGQRSSFAMNQALNGRNVTQVNPRTVLFFESDAGWNGTGGVVRASSHGHTISRGEPGVVVVYVDGSTSLVPQSLLARERWQP